MPEIESAGGMLGRWGWPIMGALAAAPVLAHALDWRRRAEAKQRKADERVMRLQTQLTQAKELVPTGGDDVYKAAAFMRKFGAASERRPEEKLDALQTALMKIKQATRK
jgi:hypothetical protein